MKNPKRHYLAGFILSLIVISLNTTVVYAQEVDKVRNILGPKQYLPVSLIIMGAVVIMIGAILYIRDGNA